ncbi:9871_t:CDS:2 [Funneliformis caledonium]|uniref:9871_t:CDS:1 n=1 Tax=Funneliformis caledonium TaxID=1117310 RepID=A0A9N9CJL3_9GLOM|nr:9871_t:CDS:2 [Funneliformis caledonium]
MLYRINVNKFSSTTARHIRINNVFDMIIPYYAQNATTVTKVDGILTDQKDTKNKSHFRKEVAEKILDDIERNGKVLISSPPFSGKSALAQLVGLVAIKKGVNVIGIPFAGYIAYRDKLLEVGSQSEINIFFSYIQKYVTMEWTDLIANPNTLLIIDDAHNIYHVEVCL